MKKTNFSLSLNLTFLKIMGFFIIVLGFTYGFLEHDSMVVLNSLYIGITCWGLKKGLDTIRVVKNGTNSLDVKNEN